MSERQIICADLGRAIDDLKGQGYRLDVIFPADYPSSAVLSRAAETVRLSTPEAPIIFEGLPPIRPESVLTKAATAVGLGRAGMGYRDLIPGRLGGRYIASHITIPERGPVADWVHYHRLALQLIYVRKGWVRVVYEDQGEPFVMNEGDLVLQPPLIRHRVLESSRGLEVVEISAPAMHETFADHDMELPNGTNPFRLFGRQEFLWHRAAETSWTRWNGAETQETALSRASGGIAEARTIRPGDSSTIEFRAHDGELVFGFVLKGDALLGDAGLAPGDAFVIHPELEWSLTRISPDFRLLHVTTARLDDAASWPL